MVKRCSAVLLIIAIIMSLQILPVEAANAAPTGTVTAAGVNLREGAGTNYTVLETLAKKAKASLLSWKLYNKDWYYVKTASGKKGYISKSYFKLDENQIYLPASIIGYRKYTVGFGKSFINTTGTAPTWTSSDTSIATINENGKIKGVKAGTAKITVKANGRKAVSTVTIKDAKVTLDKTAVEIFSDHEPFTLKATCVRPVTFTSSKPKVAAVDSNGTVTPKSVGTAKVTASSRSGSASCVVTIRKRTIDLSVSKTTMYVDNYAVIKPSGGISAYKYSSSNPSVVTVDGKGIVKAVAVGTATVTVKSGALSAKKKFTVKSGAFINLSNTLSTINATKTLYIKSATYGVKWKSSDSKIATVDNGYVYGVRKGYAVISAYTSGGCKDCLVKVNSAEAVRFAYSSQNSVLLNKTINLYAITDTKRTGVRFKLINKSTKDVTWIKKTTKSATSKRVTWKASAQMTKAGNYVLKAYSRTAKSSKYITSDGGRTTFCVNSSSDRTKTTHAAKLATTSLLRTIASYEGFLSKVTPDALVADSPTVGYGRVAFAGAVFYNGMTKSEAFAYLVKTVNESGFTTRVNQLLRDNKIKYNQAQFDALVDFSYNLGAYAIEIDSNFMAALKDTYGKASNKLKGYIRVKSAPLKKSASANSTTLKSLSANTTVTLKSSKVYKNAWYMVTTSDGKVGYVKTAYVVRRTTDTTVRDLRNMSYSKIKSNLLHYHHASGVCYWGLLYRRIDEVEMFYFRDYTKDGSANKYNIKYYCSGNPSFGMG